MYSLTFPEGKIPQGFVLLRGNRRPKVPDIEIASGENEYFSTDLILIESIYEALHIEGCKVRVSARWYEPNLASQCP